MFTSSRPEEGVHQQFFKKIWIAAIDWIQVTREKVCVSVCVCLSDCRCVSVSVCVCVCVCVWWERERNKGIESKREKKYERIRVEGVRDRERIFSQTEYFFFFQFASLLDCAYTSLAWALMAHNNNDIFFRDSRSQSKNWSGFKPVQWQRHTWITVALAFSTYFRRITSRSLLIF